MKITLRIWIIVCALSGLSCAQENGPIELSLHGRAIESPILKYRLLPAEAEIKPGNPVPILLRLPCDQRPFMSEVFPKFDEWRTRPLNDPLWAESDGVLPQRFYDEMKRAAIRRDVNWEYPFGEGGSPYLILLPDVQELRGWLGRGLSARIRYHISRGEFDLAREGIMVGLANTRHIAHTTTYITQMVAVAIQRVMFDRVEELISQPKSPNLYWALSQLPDSLLEFHRAASFASDEFTLSFPALNDLDRPRGEDEWKRMTAQFEELLEAVGDVQEKGFLKSITTKARGELSTRFGISADQVAKMSDEEASLRWYARIKISYDQRLAVALLLPAAEAWPELIRLKDEFASLRSSKDDTVLGDPVHIYLFTSVINRRVQALRIVEAIRDHIASHDGRLPGSLEEIKDLPIPVDPITRRPFAWKLNGNWGTLTAPPLHTDPIVVQSKLSDIVKIRGTLEYRLKAK